MTVPEARDSCQVGYDSLKAQDQDPVPGRACALSKSLQRTRGEGNGCVWLCVQVVLKSESLVDSLSLQ